MQLVERFWTAVNYLASCLTLGGVESPVDRQQVPLLGPHGGPPGRGPPGRPGRPPGGGPIFRPPIGKVDSDLVCDYTAMGSDWQSCSTATNRTCWLKNIMTGEVYDIHTDYETKKPKGVVRRYSLDVSDVSFLNVDGLNFPEAKLFSDFDTGRPVYPGPWIQACWGDTVLITVNNHMRYNGTSIHWHGIRMLNTTYADGVNGVTQCPIAPGDSFTYNWTAWQYGSSWYHSHYSMQYADGVAGPLTLHGPTSDPNWDEPKSPILMTDWGHNSAFNATWNDLYAPSILLNGKGNAHRYDNSITNTLQPPTPHTLTFDPPPPNGKLKRYLLRLINTSFESTFIFSIDNHMMTVISADFVPIVPYNTTNVLIGIGQRYNVIITAKPLPDERGNIPKDLNFWMRTTSPNCFLFPPGSPGYDKTGILRYTASTVDPTSTNWTFPTACSDEPYDKLVPVVKWQVSKPPTQPANDPAGDIGENLTVQIHAGGSFDPTMFPLARFSLGGDTFNPMYLDYSNPIFLRLNYSGAWPPRWVVYPENYKSTDWVYLLIKGLGGRTAAHPIHLHGHDFAILQQSNNFCLPGDFGSKIR